MWSLDEELERHFEKVKARREAGKVGSDDDDDDDDEDVGMTIQNEYARGRGRGR
jgi:hypothetical protein